MPVIEFSQKDILRGVIVEPAWYRVHIDEVGTKLSAKGDSTNYLVSGTIIRNADNGNEGDSNKPIAGVPIDWNFNSKAIGFMVEYFKAFGVEVQPGVPLELEATTDKEIDIHIENDVYEGRPKNQVNHKYRPCKED